MRSFLSFQWVHSAILELTSDGFVKDQIARYPLCHDRCLVSSRCKSKRSRKNPEWLPMCVRMWVRSATWA